MLDKGKKSEIQMRLIDFISEAFFVEKNDINIDESLVSSGIIDSIGLIEISDYISSTYHLTISESDMNADNFGSISKMVEFIDRNVS